MTTDATPTPPPTLAAIEARHGVSLDAEPRPYPTCKCGFNWPCDAATLLAMLKEATDG